MQSRCISRSQRAVGTASRCINRADQSHNHAQFLFRNDVCSFAHKYVVRLPLRGKLPSGKRLFELSWGIGNRRIGRVKWAALMA
jgi:hypothetical protein